MPIDFQGRTATENPTGRGLVFKDKRPFVEVFYQLHVFKNSLSNGTLIKQLVTGKIKAIDGANTLWGEDKLTLHLQDKRLLDFICVNFTPECDISSDTGFYK